MTLEVSNDERVPTILLQRVTHCSLAYSALACFRTGMSASASFHSVRKS